EQELMRMTARTPDLGLSALIVPAVTELYDLEPEEIYEQILRAYIEDQRAELSTLYANYEADTRATPLLFQPEAFMLFERLANYRFRLREAWPTAVEVELLEKLADVRGIALG